MSIDERRAKFRQDLILQKAPCQNVDHYRKPSHAVSKGQPKNHKLSSAVEIAPDQKRFRSRSRGPSRSPSQSSQGRRVGFASVHSETPSNDSVDPEDEDEEAPQSISELWFPGCHADIGGGWNPDAPDNLSLSHAPLVWMVREAQKAGLVFNTEKMRELSCYYDDTETVTAQKAAQEPRGRMARNKSLAVPGVPVIEVNDDILPASPDPNDSPSPAEQGVDCASLERMAIGRSSGNSKFIDYLHASCTKGKIHDPLRRNTGTPPLTVLQWNVMEYLPFRRMDLRPDGTWKVISWPLPMGETRDVPRDVKVHNSAIKRMRADETYRPGNLIIGGGGRGLRKAPGKVGMGEWEVLEEGKGHPIDEVYVRAGVSEEKIVWGGTW